MAKYLTIFLLLFPLALAAASKLDSDQPIDISADELEVRQQEKQATFSGNVIARQGNITMQSGRMTVYYADEKGSAGANSPMGGTSISRIVADGGVFFTTPDETARGGKAIYDVVAEQIRMIGDVTLTRDQSVVKGSGLVYNFKTGRSVLTSGGAGQKDGGRVRGLFVPGQEK